MGNYHGKDGFLTFSHQKAVLDRPQVSLLSSNASRLSLITVWCGSGVVGWLHLTDLFGSRQLREALVRNGFSAKLSISKGFVNQSDINN